MAKYIKKPIVVEAIQLTDENKEDITRWINETKINATQSYIDESPVLLIATLEGIMTASLGDYVIKGVKGEFYPCKPYIFEQTYDAYNKSKHGLFD